MQNRLHEIRRRFCRDQPVRHPSPTGCWSTVQWRTRGLTQPGTSGSCWKSASPHPSAARSQFLFMSVVARFHDAHLPEETPCM